MMDTANGMGPELGDLDFQYADADSLQVELSELYSYSEEPELRLGPEKLTRFVGASAWRSGNEIAIVRRLLEAAESANEDIRSDAVSALLYISQGTWAEADVTELELSERSARVIANVRTNCLLLYCQGAWPLLLQLLRLETERPAPPSNTLCLADSRKLRTIVSLLCTIAEVFRHIGPDSSRSERLLKATFCEELSQPTSSSPDSLVALSLLQMEGLPAALPDTTDVVKGMRPASPPASLVDMIEVQQQRKSSRGQFKRQSLVKQSSMDDQEPGAGGGPPNGGVVPEQTNIDPTELPDGMPDERPLGEPAAVGEPQIARSDSQEKDTKNGLSSERANSDDKEKTSKDRRGLPWQPKAALRDIDNFLAQARMKFVCFQLPNDTTTLAGLPEPILQGLRVLERHKYTPLSEAQIMREMQIERHPFTHQVELQDTPAERLYQTLLPQMPQHMISLLKILLAAAPTSKAKTESVNILADILPTADASPENCASGIQGALLGFDINRHKEVLVKAIAAVLLLLLKHVKISHCLQFEYIAQQLMFANCIPLVLKFFNQNVVSYAAARHTLPFFEFPRVVLERSSELVHEMMEGCTEVPDQSYCWRNVFACINLLRILNKLTKNKHSRVMMLVVFKSAPILKRALKVRQAMLQLYALKLLKMQTKYLGRQWRKTNMKTMSAIYHKVRHRLGDDWAYGSDLDARPWDFQAEEFSLQAAINDFHRRRYDRLPGAHPGGAGNQNSTGGSHGAEVDPLLDLEPVDNCFLSVLGRQFELLPDFKENYRYWLKCQVYDAAIEWEKLLESPNL
ncbi:striatin-interacting protein 1-like isoform X2 [Varroa destructor]|uniref:Uncharacterized protein n=1 Tax=Varroa destructor TaxID=109461 RepID=A0A7M7MCD9_VARDE|nr:striatin-interacting protein 1-like isoform X2 [Varroa destructor]